MCESLNNPVSLLAALARHSGSRRRRGTTSSSCSSFALCLCLLIGCCSAQLTALCQTETEGESEIEGDGGFSDGVSCHFLFLYPVCSSVIFSSPPPDASIVLPLSFISAVNVFKAEDGGRRWHLAEDGAFLLSLSGFFCCFFHPSGQIICGFHHERQRGWGRRTCLRWGGLGWWREERKWPTSDGGWSQGEDVKQGRQRRGVCFSHICLL